MSNWREYGEKGLQRLVGKSIAKIQMDESELIFTTKDGEVYGYTVEGDCCSSSYFHDFIGVAKLLSGNPIVSASSVSLDLKADEEVDRYDVIECYGYEIVTNDPKWGELTSVFSFRNSSNGYYGGSMYPEDSPNLNTQEITEDTTL